MGMAEAVRVDALADAEAGGETASIARMKPVYSGCPGEWRRSWRGCSTARSFGRP